MRCTAMCCRPRAPKWARPSVQKPVLTGVHILVLEDDPDAREIVSTAVTDAGASVTAVGSVAEALGTLRDQRGDQPLTVNPF